MSLVLADQVLTLREMAEVIAIVRSGLGTIGRSWNPRVYAILDEWCDQVEERLDEGDAEAIPDLPAHVPVPTKAKDRATPAPPQRPARRSSRPPRASRPGELHCPRHDGGAGQWLPIAAFRRRVDLAGEKYQSWCRDCTNAYAKAKYLSAETMRALATEGILVGTLSPSDPLLEKRCPLCPERWKPTDRIVAGGVVVFHKECLTTTEEGHGHEGD